MLVRLLSQQYRDDLAFSGVSFLILGAKRGRRSILHGVLNKTTRLGPAFRLVMCIPVAGVSAERKVVAETSRNCRLVKFC